MPNGARLRRKTCQHRKFLRCNAAGLPGGCLRFSYIARPLTPFSRVFRRRRRRRRKTREKEASWALYVARSVKLPRASRGHLNLAPLGTGPAGRPTATGAYRGVPDRDLFFAFCSSCVSLVFGRFPSQDAIRNRSGCGQERVRRTRSGLGQDAVRNTRFRVVSAPPGTADIAAKVRTGHKWPAFAFFAFYCGNRVASLILHLPLAHGKRVGERAFLAIIPSY